MSKNYDVIAAHYAASDRGDIAGMMAPLRPESRWTEMAGFPYAGTYVGPQGVIDGVFKRIGADWEGYNFKLETLLDADTSVVGVGTYRGTFRATGKSMTARVVHVWTMRDGKVEGFEQFTDTKLVADAMV